MFITCFGLSAVLLVISMSLKTLLLSLRVSLRALEASLKAAGKVGKKVADKTGLSDSDVGRAARTTKAATDKAVGAVKKTGQVAVKTGKAVVKTGKAAVKTVKITGKVAVKAAKAGKKAVELTIKAIKLLIRAIQLLIKLIHAVVAFLASLGVVGIIILVVIVLALIGAVAGALLSISSVPGGGFTVGGGASGLATPILGGGSTGIYSPGGVTPSQPDAPGGGTVVVNPGDTTGLYNSCQKMAEWYIANVTTYSAPQTTWYQCPLLGKNVGDSCAYFASAYACYVSSVNIMQGGSGEWYKRDSATANALRAAGWVQYTMTEVGGVSGLRPGDIIVSPKGTSTGGSLDPLVSSSYGHCEVYLGQKQSFGWGSVKSKFPSNTTQLTDTVKRDSSGNSFTYAGDGGYHLYGIVWRYTGGS